MKGVTAARIVRYVIMIVIIVAILYPAISLVSNVNQEGSGVEMGIDAVYDLDLMDEGSLASNISQFNSSGYIITYGDQSTPLGGNVNEIAAEVIASGADTATVVDSTGNVAVTDSITYLNSIGQTVMGGLKSEALKGALTPEFAIVYGGSWGEMPIQSQCTVVDGNVTYSLVTPYVVAAAATVIGGEMEIQIGYEYFGIIGFSLNTVDTVAPSGTFKVVDGDLIMTCDLNARASSGTIGGCTYSVVEGADGWIVTIEDVASLASGAVDGCLTVSSGEDSYTMPAEITTGFISAVEYMEGHA